MINPFLKKTSFFLFLSIFALIIFTAISCKEEYTQIPVITLKKHPPYLYKDTMSHINEEILVGIIANSVGKGNAIEKMQIEKNDTILFDSTLNKSSVFFECRLNLNSYDSTLYYFSFFDNAYNSNYYFIRTTQFIDTIPVYDTIWDTITVTRDTLIFDSIYVKDIDTLIHKIDTLIKIEL